MKKMTSKVIAVFLIALLAIGSTAMAADVSTFGAVGADKITIAKNTVRMYVGETSKLNVTTEPAEATCRFSSSDSTVATVDPDGTVHGLTAGNSTITISSGAKKTFTNVLVAKKLAEPEIRFTINDSVVSSEAFANTTTDLKAKFVKKAGVASNVRFESSNPSVAAVDSLTGEIIFAPGASGKVTIKAVAPVNPLDPVYKDGKGTVVATKDIIVLDDKKVATHLEIPEVPKNETSFTAKIVLSGIETLAPAKIRGMKFVVDYDSTKYMFRSTDVPTFNDGTLGKIIVGSTKLYDKNGVIGTITFDITNKKTTPITIDGFYATDSQASEKVESVNYGADVLFEVKPETNMPLADLVLKCNAFPIEENDIRVGNILVASIDNLVSDNIPEVTFKWYVDGKVVSSDNNYTLKTEDSGKEIYAECTVKDNITIKLNSPIYTVKPQAVSVKITQIFKDTDGKFGLKAELDNDTIASDKALLIAGNIKTYYSSELNAYLFYSDVDYSGIYDPYIAEAVTGTQDTILLGDADNNGQIGSNDATQALLYNLQLDSTIKTSGVLNEKNYLAANVNRLYPAFTDNNSLVPESNSEIDLFDAVSIQKYFVNTKPQD